VSAAQYNGGKVNKLSAVGQHKMHHFEQYSPLTNTVVLNNNNNNADNF